nr:PREDICTED: probable serine/threonine-protein kinase samkC [Paralichthys olivaceus]XP_019942439.1 PREDICTED: probable serine/threonine-protein kinase samkC [Paralichthys olivaceus]XP_019942448.1 PREDICTED: probable serine/threonine-protein kinase samkC [Paralichthys olivaceus]
MSESRGSTDDPSADRTTLQSRPGPEHLSLSRCAACYNIKSSSVTWRGDHGESSSSAEDSGPEVDDESETDSSSSSSSRNETPEPERSGDAAEDESRGGGGGGEDGDETGETSNRREEKNKPSSLTPHLIPLSFLPRPPQVVSTLHLQVFPQNRGDDETFFSIRQRRPEGEEEETQERYRGRGGGGGRGGGSINRLMPQQPPQCQQMMLPWQRRSQPTVQQHHHQQQRPKPRQLSAQGQRSPPPSHTRPPTLCTPLWAPNPPHTHLHALTPQPCWRCRHAHPPNTHCSH